MVRGLFWATLVVLAVCGPRSSAAIDCGSSRQGPGADYDAAGRSCVWDAYSSGNAVRWSVQTSTIEGDPIPTTLRFEPGTGIEITRDVTADNFSAPADRRVWTWRCDRMAKMNWLTDASRYSFVLTGCTGDGLSTGFPG